MRGNVIPIPFLHQPLVFHLKPAGRTDDFATAMPVGICLAATWDPDLGYREGEAIGQEARARGKDIMLGPGVNILRTHLCGRNFEYLGEDPFLTSQMCVGYIRGEQSQDVASCVKHFALNNQEFDRMNINVMADERALREIYLPAFKAAVQASTKQRKRSVSLSSRPAIQTTAQNRTEQFVLCQQDADSRRAPRRVNKSVLPAPGGHGVLFRLAGIPTQM